MDATLTALAVAVVGVVGTLVSPVLSQRVTARTNRASADLDANRRREERQAAERRAVFEERRTESTALNSLARTCRNEFQMLARAHMAGIPIAAEQLAAAHEARLAYERRYDGAQMILPDQVLEMASRLNVLLGDGYQKVKAVAAGEEAGSAVVELCSGAVLDLVTMMRHEMRADLGVAESFIPSTYHLPPAPRSRVEGQTTLRPGPETATPRRRPG